MDIINQKILSELKKNARIGWGQLADISGISRQSLKKRIDRLERKGDIVGYTILTPSGLTPLELSSGKTADTPLVRAFLRIRFTKENNCFKLAKVLSAYKAVTASWEVTGDWDNVIFAEAESMEQISEIREMIVQTGGIDEIETEAVLSEISRRA
ncbi:MAG: Lrp/AsnC family transcriptional regulator [Rhodospirillales bacterium]